MKRQNRINYVSHKAFDIMYLTIIFSLFILIDTNALSSTRRRLDSVDEICALGSQELVDYYNSSDLSSIGIDENEPITCEDKDKPHIKALIDLLKSELGSGDDEDESTELTLRRNLEEKEIKDYAIEYGKHLIPYLAFLVVAILCIPGWFICCFCCCCNCCCCCCCKKEECKVPCFFITFAFYAAAVAICIYGLSQSNQVFEGIANTECALLKFVDEVVIGESKADLPKWAGIDGIKGILDGLNVEINDMAGDTPNQLEGKINNVNIRKNNFLNGLENLGNLLNTGNLYRDDYIYHHSLSPSPSLYQEGDYVLDLVKGFGTYDAANKKGVPETSTTGLWVTEYQAVSSNADEQMDDASESFNQILVDQLSSITDALNTGSSTVDDLDSSFSSIKDDVLEVLNNNAKTIDENGKLGFKAYYGVLTIMIVALAAFIFLICLCSGKSCTNCCCCRCICKLFTHLLWNILWLLMIMTFLLGSIVSLVGQVGGDLMSVISYIVSKENLNSTNGIDFGGDSSKYLSTCINSNGSLENEIGFDMSSLNNLETLDNAQQQIQNITTTFKSIINRYVYNNISKELNNRIHFNTSNFNLLTEDESSLINLGVVLESFNDKSRTNIKEEYTFTCTSSYNSEYDQSHSDLICFNPTNCLPCERKTKHSSYTSNNQLKENSEVTEGMKNIMEKAKSSGGFKEKLDDLGDKYYDFLNSYIEGLNFFNTTIAKITDKLNQYNGPGGGIMGFLNCKFIGKNVKIILKYLKDALGQKLKTIGILLIVVGCALFVSISSTILIIVIINIGIDKNKELEKRKNEIGNYPLNEGGRLVGYR